MFDITFKENKKKFKIFLICGEESGSNIILEVLKHLSKKHDLSLYGIVNNNVKKEFNVKTIFPIEEISKMGLTSIISALPNLLDKIKYTRQQILSINPDLIISVDSYDFCIKVDSYIRKKNSGQKIIHIVSPTIWLYRKSRIYNMISTYNLLMCIFPQELDFYKHSKLETKYIGNLVFDQFAENYNKKENLIAVTIGSREEEILNHIPLVQQVILQLLQYNSNLIFKILAVESSVDVVNKYFQTFSNVEVITDKSVKQEIIKNAYFAIAKSGTNTLEFIASGTPLLVYYKTSWFNAFFAFIFGIRYVNIVNIFKNAELVKEFVQHKATAANIVNYIKNVLDDKSLWSREVDKLKKINETFRPSQSQSMGACAADVIEDFIQKDKKIYAAS